MHASVRQTYQQVAYLVGKLYLQNFLVYGAVAATVHNHWQKKRKKKGVKIFLKTRCFLHEA